MTAPQCLHDPGVKLILTSYYTRSNGGLAWKRHKKGTFIGLFSKTMLCFLLSNGSLFIKDQAEILTEKNHVGKDVNPKAIYVYTVCLKSFIFIF